MKTYTGADVSNCLRCGEFLIVRPRHLESCFCTDCGIRLLRLPAEKAEAEKFKLWEAWKKKREARETEIEPCLACGKPLPPPKALPDCFACPPCQEKQKRRLRREAQERLAETQAQDN